MSVVALAVGRAALIGSASRNGLPIGVDQAVATECLLSGANSTGQSTD
jgi:hypothetical protein